MGNLEDNRIAVSIKYGDGFEAPWDVRHYPDQSVAFADLASTYEIDATDMDWPTLVAEATAKAQGIWAVKNQLGATIERSRKGWGGKGAGRAARPDGKADEKSGEEVLLEAIAGLQSADEARAWGAAHKAVLTKVPAVVAAFKTRVAELNGGEQNKPAQAGAGQPETPEPKAEPERVDLMQEIAKLGSLADAQAWGRANKPVLLKDADAVAAFRDKMSKLKEDA